MKYITLIIGLLVVGCGKQKQTDTNESTPTTNTNEVDGATAKPVKELTAEEKVVGEYEWKEDGDSYRAVLLENGVFEGYGNGKKHREGKWSIVDGEIHVIYVGTPKPMLVAKINKDESITWIAVIDKDGKREAIPKGEQFTSRKIK